MEIDLPHADAHLAPVAEPGAVAAAPEQPVVRRAADGQPLYKVGEAVVSDASWRDMEWCLDDRRSGEHGFAARTLRRNKLAERADEEIAVAFSFLRYVASHVEPEGSWWLAFSGDFAVDILADWLRTVKQGGLHGTYKSQLQPATLNKYLLTVSSLFQWADDTWAAHPAWELSTTVTQRMRLHVSKLTLFIIDYNRLQACSKACVSRPSFPTCRLDVPLSLRQNSASLPSRKSAGLPKNGQQMPVQRSQRSPARIAIT